MSPYMGRNASGFYHLTLDERGGENSMTSQQVLETLEKQLQLLSERSKDCSVDEQVKLTEAMVEISRVLLIP